MKHQGFAFVSIFLNFVEILRANCLFQQSLVKMGPILLKANGIKVPLQIVLVHVLLRANKVLEFENLVFMK